MQIMDQFGAAPGAESVRMPDGTERTLAAEHAAAILVNEQPAFRVVCTPELLREVLDAAADEAHCRVIFDPVNLFCARDGQDKAYQTAHWSRWLEVIGSQLGAVHVKDCRIEADGSKTLLPLGAGDMDYTAIRAFLAACAPAAPLIRDEVILTADTADVRYLRRMTDTV